MAADWRALAVQWLAVAAHWPALVAHWLGLAGSYCANAVACAAAISRPAPMQQHDHHSI